MLPVGGWADKWNDSYGSTWEYDVKNQEATVYGYKDNGYTLENLFIPEKLGGCPVTVIDAATFSQSFSSVIIPATVQEIGNKAFQHVNRVICKGETPAKLGRTVFYNDGDELDENNFVIYVPKSAVASYKTAWSDYASYIKESPAGTTFSDNGHTFRINDDCNTITLVKASSDYYLDFNYGPYYLGNFYTVSAIGESALAGYTTINTVLIPSNITSIGDNAFANSHVSDVFVESDTPAEMGENVFKGVSNLKIYVPETKMAEYKSKWQDCAEYIIQKPVGETFTFSDCEYTIEAYSFFDFSAKLSKYNGKESVIDLEKLSGFKYDGKVWNVQNVAAEAFKGNTFIERVIMPENNHLNIGESAFADCSSLSAVICKDGEYHYNLEGQNVFSGCADNLVFYVPQDYVEKYKTAVRWSAYADRIQASKAGIQFEEGDFRFLINSDMSAVAVIGYNGSASDVTVPSSVNYEEVSYNVTTIGDNGYQAFANNENIETITLPASVTSVSVGAIQDLNNLRRVYFLSKSPVIIEHANFWGCGDGYKFYVPKGTAEAYGKVNAENVYTAFKEDLRGTDYQVGNLVYHINQDFTLTLKEYKGTDDAMVSIAKEVKVDGETYTVASIADNVFADKSFIKTFVVMGDALTRLEGQNVFAGCAEDMVIYVLPSMVDTYKAADDWSAYADHIQSSIAGKEFTSGNYTFVLNEDLQSVGVSRYDCSERTKTLEIPSQFTDSESGTTYPVTTIKSNAFEGSYVYQINTVIIPASVTLIEEDGLQGCRNIHLVQLLGNATCVKNNAFGEDMNYNESYIVVSEDAYDYYRNTFDGSWSSYHNKVAVLGESRVLTDNDALPTKRYLYKSGTLTYRRSVAQAGQYATLVLPFGINLSDVSGLETAYMFRYMMIHYLNSTANNNEGVEKFILMLTKGNGYISAGRPLILKLSAGSNEISITNTENVVLDPGANIYGNMMDVMDWDGKSGVMEYNDTYRFNCTGTFAKIDVGQQPGTVYSFNPDGTFGPQTSGVINPFRIYLRADIFNTTYARYNISIGVNDGEATGVRELVTTPVRMSPDAVYDINGRLVNMNGSIEGLANGIYVVGGKKVVVNK